MQSQDLADLIWRRMYQLQSTPIRINIVGRIGEKKPSHHIDAVKSYTVGDTGTKAIVDTRSYNDIVRLQKVPQLGGSRHVLGCITVAISVSVGKYHIA